MSSNLNKLISILKFLGLNPNMHEYRWRFFVQKIAFIAKALGMDMTYNFTIYVAGPYSRDLNCDYFPNENKTKINSLQSDYTLTNSDLDILKKIKASSDLFDNQSLMEATSTAVFLMNNSQITEDEVFSRLKEIKPHLGDSNRIIGISKAKELMFKPEYLTDEIKREIDEWDKLESC